MHAQNIYPSSHYYLSPSLSLSLCIHVHTWLCTWPSSQPSNKAMWRQIHHINTITNIQTTYIGPLNLTSFHFHPCILIDTACSLAEWPEIKAGCTKGPCLNPEGVEISFDPTQGASLCQVNPTHGNTEIDSSISFHVSLSTAPLCEPFQLGKLVLICNEHASLCGVIVMSDTVNTITNLNMCAQTNL